MRSGAAWARMFLDACQIEKNPDADGRLWPATQTDGRLWYTLRRSTLNRLVACDLDCRIRTPRWRQLTKNPSAVSWTSIKNNVLFRFSSTLRTSELLSSSLNVQMRT